MYRSKEYGLLLQPNILSPVFKHCSSIFTGLDVCAQLKGTLREYTIMGVQQKRIRNQMCMHSVCVCQQLTDSASREF